MAISQAFEVSLGLVHNMACQRNLQLLVVKKRRMLDRHRQLHRARRQRFAGAYLSYDGFETKPIQLMGGKQIN